MKGACNNVALAGNAGVPAGGMDAPAGGVLACSASDLACAVDDPGCGMDGPGCSRSVQEVVDAVTGATWSTRNRIMEDLFQADLASGVADLPAFSPPGTPVGE